MKIIEENIGSKILDITHSNILSHISPQARETKAKINKWDYIKLKYFCTAKKTINTIKNSPQNWRTCSPTLSDKGLISEIYKELTKFNTKKPRQSN